MITTEMLVSEKTALEKQLADLEPKRRRLALITELLKTYESDEESSPRLLDVPKGGSPSQRFSGMGATEAAIAFLAENPMRYFTPREIAIALQAGGLHNTSENFATMIATVCIRVSGKGKIEAGKKDGRKAYRNGGKS